MAPNRYKSSEKGDAYIAFFKSLIHQPSVKHHFTITRTVRAQECYSFPTGTSGCTYAVCFGRRERVRTEVWINTGDCDKNKEIFDALHARRTEIEGNFGEKLAWPRLDGKCASRIAIDHSGSIEYSAQSLSDIEQWCIAQLLKFKSVLGPRLP
jgi:hypothetical protein